MELEVLGMRCRILPLSRSPAPSSLSSSICNRTVESGTVGWAHLCLWICTCLCPSPESVKIMGWCHAGSHGACAVYRLTTSLSFVMLMGSPLDRGNHGACAWMLVWCCLSVFMRFLCSAACCFLLAWDCCFDCASLVRILKTSFFLPALVHRMNSSLNTCGWPRTYGLCFKCNSLVDPLQFLEVSSVSPLTLCFREE